jgi:integrase
MHDKSMTELGMTPQKKGQPFARVKHGSAVVPIYKGKVHKWVRYTVAFHMNGKRVRRTFGSLEKAKTEAQLIARKIQEGLSATNDLRPQEREAFLTARSMLSQRDLPLLPVIEEYLQCRQRLGDVPLLSAVEEFLRRTNGVKMGRTVPEIIPEFFQAKTQDQASKRYLDQLKHALNRFAEAFPGEILAIQTNDIDKWLRGMKVSPVTRNGMLRMIKVFFSFAKSRAYLPKSEATAVELLSKVKEGETKTEIFTPEQMERLLSNAPAHLIPIYAIGGFAGLRTAEIGRLSWTSVNLDRRIIELRAGQAKTASRRIVPISDNLASWLDQLPREGMIVPDEDRFRQATAFAKKLDLAWPHNVLRHSYISYRLAHIQNANQVALEAGNSPTIIFKHYRELVSLESAEQWFAIKPPVDWKPSRPNWCRQKRVFLSD